jgi:hypothetical protein
MCMAHAYPRVISSGKSHGSGIAIIRVNQL